MLPFERLRSIARSTGASNHELAMEVAECFANYPTDPAQLVVVARRLLAHRLTCGPLWWVCARVAAAADAPAAARDAYLRLERDPTASRISSSLPFPSDAPVITLGWPETISEALLDRLDLDVVVSPRDQGDEHLAAYFSRAQVPFRLESSSPDLAASHLLIESSMSSPTLALVPIGTTSLRAAYPKAATWLVIAEGCLVPEKLFTTALQKRSEVDDDYDQETTEVLAVATVSRIAGPNGIDRPDRLRQRMDCPIVPELLRL